MTMSGRKRKPFIPGAMWARDQEQHAQHTGEGMSILDNEGHDPQGLGNTPRSEPIKYTGPLPLLTVLRDSCYIGQEAMRHSAAAEIERLRALVSEAAKIMEGDGEYPETAKRFREALGDQQPSSPREKHEDQP